MKKENTKSVVEQISKDGILEELKKAVSLLSLKEADIKSVADNKKSDIYGAMIFALPILFIFLFTTVSLPVFVANYTVGMVVLSVASFFAAIYACILIADKGFKVKLSMRPLFRIMSYSSIVLWPLVLQSFFSLINLYPLARLFSIANYLVIWIFIVLYFYLEKIMKMKHNDAIIVSVLTGVAYFLVSTILGSVLFGGFYGMGMYF